MLLQRNKYLLALQETALELVSQLDLETLLENIVRRAGQLMKTTSGFSIWWTQRPANSCRASAWERWLNRFVIRPSRGKAWLELSGSLEHRWWLMTMIIGRAALALTVVGRFLRSSVSRCFPAIRCWACWAGHEFATHQVFEPESVEILTQFSALAAIAIENAASVWKSLNANSPNAGRTEESLHENEKCSAPLSTMRP